MKKRGDKQTLCTFCDRARTNYCSWVKSLTPVEGWNAEMVEIRCQCGTKRFKKIKSYMVKSCPSFRKDLTLKERREEATMTIPNLIKKELSR